MIQTKGTAIVVAKVLTILLFLYYLLISAAIIMWKGIPPDNQWIPFMQLADFDSMKRSLLHYSNLVPFKTIITYLFYEENHTISIKNIIGNMAVFVPFGIFLPLIALKSIKASKVIYLSLGWSLCLEIIELVFSRGTFDVDDLILNAFGAFLGFLGFRFIAIIVKLVYKKAPKQPSRSMKDKYLQVHK